MLTGAVNAQQFDWAHGAGGLSNDVATCVAVGSDGSVYVGGTFTGSASFGTFTPTATVTAYTPQDVDVFVAKYSPTGSFLWVVSGGSAFDDALTSIGVDAGNVIHIGGNFVGSGTFGTLTAIGSGGRDVFVATIAQTNVGQPSESAHFQHVFSLAGAFDDALQGLAVASDGSSYITGTFTGTVLLYTPGFPAPVTMDAFGGANDVNVFVVKLDNTCTPVWEQNVGTSTNDALVNGLVLDVTNNRLFFCGSCSTAVAIGTTQTAITGSYIAQLDLTGAVGVVVATNFNAIAMTMGASSNLYLLSATSAVRVINGVDCTPVGADMPLGIAATAIAYNDVESSILVSGPIYTTATLGNSALIVPTGDSSAYAAQFSTAGVVQWGRVIASHISTFATIARAVASRGGKNVVVGSHTGIATFGLTSHQTAGNHDAFVTHLSAANWITGMVYDDLDSNGVMGPNEHPHAGVLLRFGNDYYATRADGTFEIPVGTGASTITPVATMYRRVSPASTTVTFAGVSGGLSTGKNFALVPLAGHNDMRVAISPSTSPVPGRDITYTISMENVGTTQFGGMSMTFTFDGSLLGQPVSTFPATSSIAGNVVTWSGFSYDPTEHHQYQVKFTVPSNTAFGAFAISTATVNILPKIDETPVDNSASITQTILHSADPNAKSILPGGNMTPTQASSGPWLNYTIQFQNTGRAPAVDVVLRDTLSQNLAWSTLQTVASSNPYAVEATGRGAVAWRMTGINLADSATNEPASHGYVTYRVMPISGLNSGDSIVNTASIFFDYNSPVITKSVVTKIVQNPLISRSDSLSGVPTTFAVAHVTANAYKIFNRKQPASPILSVDVQFVAAPTVPAVGSDLRIDTTATGWATPFNHIFAAVPANDSITFKLGLVDSVAYNGTLKAIVHHVDGDTTMLQFPVVIVPPARAPDSMVVGTASTGNIHLLGRTFHIRNTKTPASKISGIDIAFNPPPRYIQTGGNLAADGSTLSWFPSFAEHIPFSPATQDSATFDLMLVDSVSPWTGNVTLIVRHSNGDSTVLTYGPWVINTVDVMQGSTLPGGFGLISVDPNPSSNMATLRYTVGSASAVSLDVINMAGQIVEKIANERMPAGEAQIQIPTRDLAPGVYMIRMSALGGGAAMRIVVAR